MPSQVIPAEVTFVDQNGSPLSGGLVYMYYPNTSTFNNTYQDQAGSILNSNPIVLDQAGRANIWGTGSYRQVVTDQFGDVQWDRITTAGGSTPVSGDIPGDLIVGGNANIAGSLNVGSGAYINGNSTVNGSFNTLDIVARNITTVGGNIGISEGNALFTDSIYSNGAGSVTFPESITVGGNVGATGNVSGVILSGTSEVITPVLASGTSSITVASSLNLDNNNISGVGNLSATTVFSPTIAVNTIDGDGANPITMNANVAVSGYLSANELLAPTLNVNTIDGDGAGPITMNANFVAAGYITAGGIITAPGVIINGDLNSHNVYPITGSTYNVGTEGNTWANVVGDIMYAHDFVTYSTDATSSPLSTACLPLVEAIAVKTAPHIGLATADISSIPGALVAQAKLADGKTTPQGVSYNAVVACLWKALQELNSAFNAYVAAHP